MSVYFANKEAIDLSAIAVMGVSVKTGDSPIGYFGTDPEGGARGVQGRIATKQATDLTSALATETALEILEQECWDLRCVNVPTGGDDYDIGWRVIEHYQAEPQERIIGYGNSPLEAMRDAIETEEKRRHG